MPLAAAAAAAAGNPCGPQDGRARARPGLDAAAHPRRDCQDARAGGAALLGASAGAAIFMFLDLF